MFSCPKAPEVHGSFVTRKYFERNEWHQRVNPLFVRYWAATKRWRFIDRQSETESKTAFDELGAASRLLPEGESKYARVWTEIMRPLDGEVPLSGEPGKAYAVNPENSAFFRDLVFLKFGISYRELITLAERDEKAHRKLLRVHQDYYRFIWSGNDFNHLRLRFNLNHFQLLVQGLAFGLDSLNELELQSCFDEICPCGQRHSGEYLKKLRAKVKKACDRLIESASKPTTLPVPGN